MATVKPLIQGTSGLPEVASATDTLPVGNIPTITSAKISDFDEASQDAVAGAITDSSTIAKTYNDGANTISLAIVAGSVGATELASTAVTPGSYTAANITVDADGRITSASSGSTGVAETYTAGEALSARDMLYVSAAGTVMKADATSLAKAAVAVTQAAVSNGASGSSMYFNGQKITGFTGLTAGSRYFLSNSTPGAIALYSALTFSTTGHIIQCVGVAESTTVLRFEIHSPIVYNA